jgi:hypothetical protein
MYSEPVVSGNEGTCRKGGWEILRVMGLEKKSQVRVVKEWTWIIKVHSTLCVISQSGKTGQVSWGLHVLILSLGCRSVGSHV